MSVINMLARSISERVTEVVRYNEYWLSTNVDVTTDPMLVSVRLDRSAGREGALELRSRLESHLADWDLVLPKSVKVRMVWGNVEL